MTQRDREAERLAAQQRARERSKRRIKQESSEQPSPSDRRDWKAWEGNIKRILAKGDSEYYDEK